MEGGERISSISSSLKLWSITVDGKNFVGVTLEDSY